MDLTDFEKDALIVLGDNLCLPQFTTKARKNTLNALCFKGLAIDPASSKSKMWELTDEGRVMYNSIS